MKKWLIIIFCLLLVACNDNDTNTADSPEKALQLLGSKEGDYPKIIKILNSIEVNEKQVFCIFKGKFNNHTEWFIANVEKDEDSNWFVKELINIGLPNSEYEKYSAGTNTFTAGLSNNPKEKKDNRIIVTLPDNDYYVWIELLDN